jgi:hypothetical protein
MFFTFQSLFPEAAAGTATMPLTFPVGCPQARVRKTHDSQSGKDGVHWRITARAVKQLCIGRGH